MRNSNPAGGSPAAEHLVDDQLVGQLLREQCPDLAETPLRASCAGWDNVVFRLGERLAVRLPRRREAVILAEREHKWLPQLADRLPIPIPSPVYVGRPGCGYPWPWSVVPWLPGDTADQAPPRSDQAAALCDFLRSLHQPAPPRAPRNALRGVPLRQRAATVAERLDRLQNVSDLITPKLRELWRQALSAAEAPESCWLHGDLHARNVLVDKGSIRGIIDWGDISAGDTATDLAAVWMLFDDPAARSACLLRYRAGPHLVARAKGWALFFGATLLESGRIDHPGQAAIGKATLQRLDQD